MDWSMFHYRPDPRVTSDRKCPDWFLDELKTLDPCLRVEWWNAPHWNGEQGPGFRLVRVLSDGRWASVMWFLQPTMTIIKMLRAADSYKRKDMDYAVSEHMRAFYNQHMEEERRVRERAREMSYGVGEQMIRAVEKGDSTVFGYGKTTGTCAQTGD